MLFRNKKCPHCQSIYDSALDQCPSCHRQNELCEKDRGLKNVFFFHPIAQASLFMVGFAYFGMLICSVVASIFLLAISDALLRTTLVTFITYLMMLSGLLTIVLITRRKLFFQRYKRWQDYAFGLAYAAGLVLAGLLIGMIVSAFHKGGNGSNQDTAVHMSIGYPILSGIILCFLGPVCEEFTYRVGLYSLLRRINLFLAIGVSALIFGLIHFDFTESDIINELWNLPSYIISGIILALAYEHRGPACSMTAHIAYNIFAFVIIFVENHG